MISEEKRSGELTNEEIERENERTGKYENARGGYHGLQDTGDKKVRDEDNVIRRNDGLPPESNPSENKAVDKNFD